MAKIEVSGQHEGRLVVDGREVTLRIARLSLEEFVEFESSFFYFGRPEPGDVVATEGDDADSVDQDDRMRRIREAIMARRASLDEAARKAEDERVLARTRELAAWVRRSMSYVSLASGELSVDGVDVTTGEGFLAAFGGRTALLMQVMNLIWIANKMPEQLKKAFGSLSDFPTFSPARGTEAVGPKPGATAPSASAGVTTSGGGARGGAGSAARTTGSPGGTTRSSRKSARSRR